MYDNDMTLGQTSLSTTYAPEELPDPTLILSNNVDFPVPRPPIIQVRFLLNLTDCLSNNPPSITISSKHGTILGKLLSIRTLELPLNRAILKELNVSSSILSLVSLASLSIFFPNLSIV